MSVLGRWRPSFLPGRWYWFVLVADGQSALRAKAQNQSSEEAEIYCGRKLKTDASAFGVIPVLPLSVWGGRGLRVQLCSMAGRSEGAQEAEGTSLGGGCIMMGTELMSLSPWVAECDQISVSSEVSR